MMMKGLIAATYTPMDENGRINLEVIPAMADHLVRQGVAGLYICGSTGEGLNLTVGERQSVTEAYVAAARGRMTTIVHVGHHSLPEAEALARHAADVGADVISAVAPSYYPITDNRALVAFMARVAAAAPALPFYYYHIPALTGIRTDFIDFMRRAADAVPTLAGAKYTTTDAHEFLHALGEFEGKLDFVWGCDECLLAGLAMGATAAIGSTYNFAAPLYRALIDRFEAGRLEEARALQALSVRMIRAIYTLPFHPAVKRLLGRLGVPCGPARLPLKPVSDADFDPAWRELEKMGAVDWFTPKSAA